MVPHGSQQSDMILEEEGDANEQLYQKRFAEGYDIYDEEYVQWLMANHPNDVPRKWLTKASASAMMPATTTASQTDKSIKSDKIFLNYSSVYEALNRPRKDHKLIIKNQGDQKIQETTFPSTCINL